MNLSTVVTATGATTHPPFSMGPEMYRLCTDTRDMKGGECFIALRGGRAFVNEAAEKGASGIVCERLGVEENRRLLSIARARVSDTPLALMVVPDADRALLDLGKWVSSSLVSANVPIVGITGSAGKTTCKDMVLTALGGGGGEQHQQQTGVYGTRGNRNNLIGLPLTLLQVPDDSPCNAVVLEMGMSAKGEIAQLAECAQPTVRVITNVGLAHAMGLCGNRHYSEEEARLQVLSAKQELFDSASPGNTCIVNVDDPLIRGIPHPTGVHSLTFGTSPMADVAVVSAEPSRDGLAVALTLRIFGSSLRTTLHAPGPVHLAMNAAAAVAAAVAAGTDASEAMARLELWRPATSRLSLVELSGGSLLLDDSYNSSPGAARTAVDTAVNMARGRGCQGVLIIGEMLELGPVALEAHAALMRHCLASCASFVLFVGSIWKAAQSAAPWDSGSTSDVSPYSIVASTAEAIALLDQGVLLPSQAAPAVILVKGSRGVGLDEVVEHLRPG